MSLYISDDKVWIKSDDSNWYNFGLQRINGRVFRTDPVAAADPGEYDEAIILPYGDEFYKTEATTHNGRTYVSLNQTPVAGPTNGPVALTTAVGLAYTLRVVLGDDGRKYLDYRLDQPDYVAGTVTQKLTAKFKGAGKSYTMRYGDDARDIIVTLTENNRALTTDPETVLMKVTNADGEIVAARELTSAGDGDWAYRVIDGDFEEIIIGSYSLQFYATWADGTNATFPTVGALSLQVVSKAEHEED